MEFSNPKYGFYRNFPPLFYHRYKEVETRAEELSDRLEQAEEDNHELQARLIDLDREFRNTLVQNQLMVCLFRRT